MSDQERKPRKFGRGRFLGLIGGAAAATAITGCETPFSTPSEIAAQHPIKDIDEEIDKFVTKETLEEASKIATLWGTNHADMAQRLASQGIFISTCAHLKLSDLPTTKKAQILQDLHRGMIHRLDEKATKTPFYEKQDLEDQILYHRIEYQRLINYWFIEVDKKPTLDRFAKVEPKAQPMTTGNLSKTPDRLSPSNFRAPEPQPSN